MSDRIAVFNDGADRAGRHRRPRSTSDPATAFVAGFVGTSNLVDGAARERSCSASRARSACGRSGCASPAPGRRRPGRTSARSRHGARGRLRSARPSGCSSTLDAGRRAGGHPAQRWPRPRPAGRLRSDRRRASRSGGREHERRGAGGAERPAAHDSAGGDVMDRPKPARPSHGGMRPGRSPPAARATTSPSAAGRDRLSTRRRSPSPALGAGRGPGQHRRLGRATPRTAPTTRRSTGCTPFEKADRLQGQRQGRQHLRRDGHADEDRAVRRGVGLR